MDLGRLDPVAVRSVWAHEARNFTPWLLANADHLADALGIDLELSTAEHPVGDFSLDLIGRDLTNDCVLIVENQLEATDHLHLGQIITYAAGTGAATIVWIATDFRDEHRQALDWLNENTPDIHFFGVQVRVVRIGQSQPAALFDLVAQPNDWQKQVREAARSDVSLSPKREMYRRFWTRFLERVQVEHPDWASARAARTDNRMMFPGTVRGTRFYLSFAPNGRLHHELYIDTGDTAANDALFDALLAQRAAIEAAYGSTLVWSDKMHGLRARGIADETDGRIENANDFDEYIDWFFDRGTRLRAALATASIS